MINIAIDGPAGAGKSTVAKAVAKKLNIVYLDTGAMYRAVAYSAIKAGISIYDEEQIKPFLANLDMQIEYGEVQQLIVNGENVTPYIREHSISKAASDVSKLTAVRLKMVDLQRQIASKTNVVLDGRDIGSFVLPNAKYKFFVTASPEVRAERRFLELKEKGGNLSYDEILKDIKDRDLNDSTRALAPLVKTEDAVLVDTSNMSIDEVTQW
jgi:cytidylate kinase